MNQNTNFFIFLAIFAAIAFIISAIMTIIAWTNYASGHPHIPDPVNLYIHHHDRLEKIRHCESRGDYQAINEKPTETHNDGTIGSYGGYQIWPALWTETIVQWMSKIYHPWALTRPDKAPPIIQDLVASVIWWRLQNIAWRHSGQC